MTTSGPGRGPVPPTNRILTGRSAAKLKTLAEKYNVSRHTTDLDAALADDHKKSAVVDVPSLDC